MTTEMLSLQHELKQLKSELREKEILLKALARHDSDTGLYRRSAFIEIFNQQLLIAAREHMPISLALVNIDQLAAFNQHHGNQQGDLALQQIAQALKSIARDSDILGRLEGEAFIILMFNTDHKETQHAAERFRSGVEALSFINDSKLTVSVGAATFGEKSIAGIDLTPTEIYQQVHDRASAALKKAKESGRNRVCF